MKTLGISIEIWRNLAKFLENPPKLGPLERASFFAFTHVNKSGIHFLLIMNKYFTLVISRTLLVSLGFVIGSISLTQADPTDDLSFTVGHFPKVEVYRWMAAERVAGVLADRLDHFPKSLSLRLAHHILKQCRKYRLDPAFILSLIDVESGFHTQALSPVGAVGLMQVMVPTANFVNRQLGIYFSGYENFHGLGLTNRSIRASELKDPFLNTAIGIAYLAWLRDYYQDMPSHYVFAAYNLGPGRMDELLSQGAFHPVGTKRYFLAIRKGVPGFRYYKKRMNRDNWI
jgi:hypothetical protein